MESVRAQMATLESIIANEKDAQAKKSEDNEDNENVFEDSNQQDTSSADEENCELSSQEAKQILFKGSTHRFLYLNTIKEDEKEYRVGYWDKFIAVGVLAIQFYSYVILLWMVNTSDIGSIPLEINQWFCSDNERLIDSRDVDELLTHESLLQNLECGSTLSNDGEAYYAFLPGIILLLCFLSQDIFESLVLFQCRGCKAKITAVVIFLEAIFAIYVAIEGTYQAASGAFDKLDTFFLIVGAIFVHDVDEQIGYWKAVERRLGRTFKCQEIQLWFLVLLIFGICYWLKEREVSQD